GPVDIIADTNHTAVVVPEVLVEIDLLSALRSQLKQGCTARAGAAGGVEDVPVVEDGGGAVGVAGTLVEPPEELAILGRDADQAFPEELHVLFYPAALGDDRRAVAGRAAVLHFGLPDDVAGLFVQGDDGGFRLAGARNESVALDQHRFGVGPNAGVAAEVGAEIFLPSDFAVGRVEANEVAVGAEGVDAVAVYSWRGPTARVWWPLVELADL